METSVIQSLIERNANEIYLLERGILHFKGDLHYFRGEDQGSVVDQIKKDISKHRQTLKKLVAIQKELKKELADNIRNENCEAIYFEIYEGVN